MVWFGGGSGEKECGWSAPVICRYRGWLTKRKNNSVLSDADFIFFVSL
jgi:hypothetical protein